MELIISCVLPKCFDHKKILKLVAKANRFDSNILIVQDKKSINAKSVLSTATLYGINGRINLHAEGRDSEKALETLKTICIED